MSRAAFHAAVTPALFRGSLPDWQRQPLDRIVDEGVARGRSLEETAYVLATAYHETGRFRHMEEIGRGQGRDYGEAVLLWRGVRQSYHGRGFVQLTWLGNYARMTARLGVDLVNEPERAKDPEIAARILWEGMIDGTYTGLRRQDQPPETDGVWSLADFFGPGRVDYVGARKIVNGTDRDEEIAGYARQFEAALRLIDAAAESPLCDACPYRRTA